jgi:competence protein ComEA
MQKTDSPDSKILLLFLLTAVLSTLVLGIPTVSSAAEKGGVLEKAKSLVDLNNADEKTLQSLPGINQAMAKAIIAGRPYKNIGDLKKIPGMTDKLIGAIKDKVSFGAMAGKTAPSTIPSAAGILDKASQQTKP